MVSFPKGRESAFRPAFYGIARSFILPYIIVYQFLPKNQSPLLTFWYAKAEPSIAADCRPSCFARKFRPHSIIWAFLPGHRLCCASDITGNWKTSPFPGVFKDGRRILSLEDQVEALQGFDMFASRGDQVDARGIEEL